MEGERALDADAERLLPHGERLADAGALALDDDALEHLDAAALALDHLEVDADGVAGLELGGTLRSWARSMVSMTLLMREEARQGRRENG